MASLAVFKALHLIFVVTWFAGLFYIVRLFVYHVEALESGQGAAGQVLAQQFVLMERRLWYGIAWPSCVLALLCGGAMIHHFLPLANYPWLVAKLCWVAGLLLYHLCCGHLYRKLVLGQCPYSSTQLRLWNELATVFLVAIVFLAVLKDSLAVLPALVGLGGVAGMLLGGVALYRKLRS